MASPYVVSQFVIITCACSPPYFSHQNLGDPSGLKSAGKSRSAQMKSQAFLSSCVLWQAG